MCRCREFGLLPAAYCQDGACETINNARKGNFPSPITEWEGHRSLLPRLPRRCSRGGTQWRAINYPTGPSRSNEAIKTAGERYPRYAELVIPVTAFLRGEMCSCSTRNDLISASDDKHPLLAPVHFLSTDILINDKKRFDACEERAPCIN